MSDLISREALKKACSEMVKGSNNSDFIPCPTWNNAMELIDNAPTVPMPDFKDGYKQAIIDGKTNFSRPQGDLADEVWKLYEKHHSHLATHVLEFGDELKELLGKYKKGGEE